jgi:nucleoside-diphosphate-sugar epimerase
MKALVTGANGFIGSHLCEELLARGYEVRGLVRTTSDLTWIKDLGLEIVYGDLRDPGSLAAAAVGVDVAFHAGAKVRARDTSEYERVNREGTRLIAEACAARGVRRFVLFSSASAGGSASSPDDPSTEEHEARPVTLYGKGKLGGEQALAALKDRLHSVILRFPAVYGPRDRDILMMLKWVKRGVLPVLGKAFSAVYVKDAVRAAVLAAEKDVPSASVYYISDGNCYNYEGVADLFENLLGKRPLAVTVPSWLVRAAGWLSETLSSGGSVFNADKAKELTQPCWVCRPERAGRELGFAPAYDLQSGMTETVKWYQEQSWL